VKAILLHTPASDNGGARHDAGAKLAVGDEAGEIAQDRAQALVAASAAIDVTPAAKKAK
jgi:hypothetical protein